MDMRSECSLSLDEHGSGETVDIDTPRQVQHPLKNSTRSNTCLGKEQRWWFQTVCHNSARTAGAATATTVLLT
jgi:hypothetical protein